MDDCGGLSPDPAPPQGEGVGCPESLQQSIICGYRCPYHQVLFPVPVMQGRGNPPMRGTGGCDNSLKQL